MLENNGSTTVFETTTLFLNYSSTNWEKPTNSNSSIKALEKAVIGFLKDLPIPLAAVITIVIVVIVVICIVCVCICRRCRKKKAKAAKANGTFGAGHSQISGLTYSEKVQPELFEDGYTESIYSEARQGKLEISLDFDFSKNELQVGVLQATDLPAADSDGFSDPYVKVFFNSNKKFKFETKVLKKTLNPVFNEHFIFKVPYSELVNDVLIFAVYDFNRIMKHTLMGLVKVPMKTLNLNRVYTDFRDITSPELELENQEEGQLGDVCFSLRYVPITGKLTVVILEAKCLRKMDNVGLSDPYVKVSMFIGKKLVKKKKTSIKRKTVTPYYNEQFTFDVLPKDINNVTLHITVIDYDRLGRSDPIGRVVLGKDANAAQRRHWDDMIKFPRRPIAQWHALTEIPK